MTLLSRTPEKARQEGSGRRGRGPGDAGRARSELRRQALVVRTLLVAAVLIAWEVLGRTHIVDPQFVSMPSEVGPRILQQFGDPTVVSALATTGRAILLSFVIGSAIGIAIGSLLGLSRLLHDAYMGPVLFLMSIPKVIFLPIFVLLFGIGTTSAVAFASFEASTYVAVSVAGGMGLVQSRHLMVARAFRASWPQRLITVVFPAALPGIFAGLWFGIKHAFVGILTAELWASKGGIGSLTRTYSENLRTSDVLALVLTVAVFAILLGALWNAVESKLTRWK